MGDMPKHDSKIPSSTILVVEPDILVRMIIADYLRDCGYKVIEAVTADDVATVLGTQQKIDLVFAEVQLGGSMDGFGLSRWIREKQPGVDVILASGIAKAAEQAAGLCDEGPVEKPYQPQEVVRRIKILFERRRTAPQG